METPANIRQLHQRSRALKCLLTSLFLLILQTAKAQIPDNETITVASVRDPDWKTYKAFLAGMHTFEQKNSLAPMAPLLFSLLSKVRDDDQSNIIIRIAGERDWARIAVANDNTFSLPHIPEAALDHADLLLNRKKAKYYWRPLIKTPELPSHVRRLGDLRLECEVRWAIEQDELPSIMKAVFNLSGGPCDSPQIKADFVSTRKISSIIMIDRSRRHQLDADRIDNDSYRFYPILHDKAWPDDTLLAFTFMENE